MSDDDQQLAEPETAATPESLLGNLVVGLAAAIGGIAVIVYALQMPVIGPGRPGPGLFPGMIGGLAALFGILLVTISLIKRRRGVDASTPEMAPAAAPSPHTANDDGLDRLGTEDEDGAVVDLELGATRKSRWINALVVLGSIVFYVAAAETLGFLITMFVILLTIMLTLGSRKIPAVAIAAGTTAALYAIFELFLLVQLPDGLLV